MDRDWINSIHISDEYEKGVEEFIQFAQCGANSSGDDGVKFRCSCVNCLNGSRLNVELGSTFYVKGFYDFIQPRHGMVNY